MTSANRAY